LRDLRELLTEPVEYCGSISSCGIVRIRRGPLKNRGECAIPEGSHYFHTHPISSFAVPSARDVLMVANRPTRRYSLIVTKWGLYHLYNNATQNHYNSGRGKLPRQVYNTLIAQVQPIIDTLIINTRVARANRGVNGNKSGNLTERKLQLVNAFCNDIRTATRGLVVITFQPWAS
jgi:hypothetical protein